MYRFFRSRLTSVILGIVLPGMASISPSIQCLICRWEISAGESCASGEATRSVTPSGKWRSASSLNRLAIVPKMSQSLLLSQHGGTAGDSGWMKLCMSVELRSAFSYQVAAGRTMSE